MKNNCSVHSLAAASRLLLAAVLLLSAGCIDFEQVIRIKPDGSGELTQSVRISQAFIETMKAAQADGGEEVSPEEMEKGLEEMKEQFRANPEELGQGVTFVDVETIPAPEGSPLPFSGFTYTLAFEDITKLDLSPIPSLGDQAGGMAPTPDGEDRLEFRFSKKGNRSVLSAVFFESEEQMKAEMADLTLSESENVEAPEGLDEFGEQMMSMFKEMLKGFRISMSVEVAGRLLETNATVVEGSRVTLLEIDFDRLMEQEEKLKQLSQMEGQPSLSTLGLMMQEVDGVTFPLTPEVTIEFR